METNYSALIWNTGRKLWLCKNCGHDEFQQTVTAQNFVTLRSGDRNTLVESDDFDGSWEVQERGDVTCARCQSLLSVPNAVDVVEESEFGG